MSTRCYGRSSVNTNTKEQKEQFIEQFTEDGGDFEINVRHKDGEFTLPGIKGLLSCCNSYFQRLLKEGTLESQESKVTFSFTDPVDLAVFNLFFSRSQKTAQNRRWFGYLSSRLKGRGDRRDL